MTNRVPPASRAKAAGHALAMILALPALRGGGDVASRALARALRRTALGGASAGEREWIARIEGRREALLAGEGPPMPPDFDLPGAVRWMSVPPILGRFLMRLGAELAPRSCLEVGTGFGFSAAYLAAGLALGGGGRVITVDVEEDWSAIAQQGFDELRLQGAIEARTGEPESTLEGAAADAAPVELAFIDADHRRDPTIRCLETIAPYASPGAVLVFDDIGFSFAEMRDAWREISGHPRIGRAHRVGRLGIAVARDGGG